MPDAPGILWVNDYGFHSLTGLGRQTGELRLFVPYTSSELTRAALSKAFGLIRNLDAHVTLFAIQVVPIALPLNRPDVNPEFYKQLLSAIAGEVQERIDVRLVLARDLKSGLREVLLPNSLAIVATRKRWWATQEMKLARILARGGHTVAVLEV